MCGAESAASGDSAGALQQAEVYPRSLRALPYEVFAPFTFDGREYHNIVATRPGAGQPGRRVVVIAHYDTVENSPGADDNASSVALALELARVLQGVELERTVQIAAVNLEERQKEGTLDEAALFGSRALAAEAQEQGWEIEGRSCWTRSPRRQATRAKTPNGAVTLPEVGISSGRSATRRRANGHGLYAGGRPLQIRCRSCRWWCRGRRMLPETRDGRTTASLLGQGLPGCF